MSANKKKPRGRPFTGRDDPRNRQNVLLAQAADFGTSPLSIASEPEDMLKAMKFVAANRAERPETHFRGHLRRWMEDDVRGFMNRLADLEKAALGASRGAGPPAGMFSEDDPGTVRALAACDEWIRKNGVQPEEQQ